MTTDSLPDGPSRDLRERIGAYFTWAAPEVGEEFGEYPTWDQLTEQDQAYGLARADAILTEIAAAGYVIVKADRFERLRAYVVADQEFSQASTWAGIWQDDGVQRKAVELQYAGREERRRAAHHAITLGDLEPGEPEAGR